MVWKGYVIMATYKSLESLKSAILKEVRSAVDAAGIKECTSEECG